MTGELWRCDEMLAAMQATPVGALPAAITGISIDSRSVHPGEAYFAIKGDVLDGHKFVAMAGKAGAGLAVVSEEKAPELHNAGVPLLIVDNVLEALERLGLAARARTKAKIIAITGSVGKTSTKEALRHVLAAMGPVHASVASFNNHWGVPLTLARMPADVRFGIFEVGMNHAGEITPLVKMVRPDIAAITNVEKAHLGAFDGIADIARAKAEIFAGLEGEGAVVLNRDNDQFNLLDLLAKKAGVTNIVTCGEADKSDLQLKKICLHASCSCALIDLFGEECAIKIGLPGRHIIQNALIVLAIAKLAGADMAKSVLALATLQPDAGRGRRHQLQLRDGPFTLIDESYNANPASMKAAIEMLQASKPVQRGRRIAVLGDMLELGAETGALHSALAEPIEKAGIDQVYLVGPQMRALSETLQSTRLAFYVPSVEAIKPVLFSNLRHGDVVMAKASKGIGFAGLVEDMMQTFTEVKSVSS